jgi:hypothetical protein
VIPRHPKAPHNPRAALDHHRTRPQRRENARRVHRILAAGQPPRLPAAGQEDVHVLQHLGERLQLAPGHLAGHVQRGRKSRRLRAPHEPFHARAVQPRQSVRAAHDRVPAPENTASSCPLRRARGWPHEGDKAALAIRPDQYRRRRLSARPSPPVAPPPQPRQVPRIRSPRRRAPRRKPAAHRPQRRHVSRALNASPPPKSLTNSARVVSRAIVLSETGLTSTSHTAIRRRESFLHPSFHEIPRRRAANAIIAFAP